MAAAKAAEVEEFDYDDLFDDEEEEAKPQNTQSHK